MTFTDTRPAAAIVYVTEEPGVPHRGAETRFPLGHSTPTCPRATGPQLLEGDSSPWPCPVCIDSDSDSTFRAAHAPTPTSPAATFVPAAPARHTSSVKPNKYQGACSRCGGHVAAEAGMLAGKVDGRWTVAHLDGQCPAKPAVSEASPAKAAPTPDVAAGRYAVDTEAGHLAFYVVDRPTDGRWAGYTFLSVQASDERHPIRGGAARSILAKIAADPKAAMIRYGLELGKCGNCGRTLTDEESRSYGIGPICRANMGW